jgi:DNA invertase Pin-like site-specific DNA recombinase
MKALLRAVTRREVDMVAAWAVDRLGSSLVDLLSFLGELHAKQVDLYLHQQGFDTSTPAGRAMFQMLGLFAEFERSMIRGRVVSGMARARSTGTKSGRAIGRPTVAEATKDAIRGLLGAGQSERAIVQQLGVSKGAVGRVRAAMAAVAPERAELA